MTNEQTATAPEQLQPGQVIKETYNAMDKALEVKDYPYGFTLRTSIFYWIETKKGKGDRFCTRTINPKNGRFNAPKCSTYSPYLYLQTDENGHVKTGGLSAYNLEVFEARFQFVLKNFYPFSLSADQQYNIRMDYLNNVVPTAIYNKPKYSADTLLDYTNWCQGLVKHIKTCDFDKLLDYPAAPEPDQPDAQYKPTVTEYKPKPEPEKPTHTITPEKVKEMIEKKIPGFYVWTDTYNVFGGQYMKIKIATTEKGNQPVSLSLNLTTLELQPQIYGGNGGQNIYRMPNKDDVKERWLAMQHVKIPFRRPACNEKDVLSAIERFAVNYRATLIEHAAVLTDRDTVDYAKLLNLPA